MSEFFSGPMTAFDAVAIVIIVLSALMALARGFMRELATLGAFVAAIAAAYYARLLFRNRVEALLPETMAPWVADFILIVVAFVLFYGLIAWVGARLSRIIQGFEGIGVLDRVAGLAFGAARGVIALVFFTLLLKMSLTEDKIPDWILNAQLYPYFASWADIVHDEAPRIADEVEERVPALGGESQ